LTNFLTNTPQSIQFLGDVSAPSPFNNGATGQRFAKQEYYITYAEDEWKLRPNLTLNYGLRYEYFTPLREDRNLQVLFDIRNGVPRDPSQQAFQSSKTNFGPRISMTWSPVPNGGGFFGGGRTVLRGGFGIFYGPGQTEDQIQPIESDRISSTFTGPIVSGGPPLAFPLDTAAAVAFFTNPANVNRRSYQPRAYAPEYKIPEKVYQYTVSLQQELFSGTVLTAAYVGSQGRNLFLRSIANKILPGQTTVPNTVTVLPSGFGVVNLANPSTGQITSVVQPIREFSIINGLGVLNPFAEVDYKTSGGSDSYNALQMTLARRITTGLTLNSQYTFSRSFGNTAGSNEARTAAIPDNFEADRGYNNFDVRHTFNFSALYKLPFGKGNALLGDWEVGGIVNARSGLPIEVGITRPDVVMQCAATTCPVSINGVATTVPQGFVAQLTSGTLPVGFIGVVNTPGGGASRNVRRPNIVPGVSPYLNNDRSLINPAAFSIPLPGTFGDLPRNALRGPNFKQFDLVLNKRFPITESTNLEFRTEIFNIFNFTNFAVPSTTLNNALPTITAAGVVSPGGLQPGNGFSQSQAGGTFGLLRQTVERTVGLGTNRQIQFALRLSF
jgi:hypothetical protein